MRCKLFKMDGPAFSDFLRHPRNYDVIPDRDIPADLEMIGVDRLDTGDHTFDGTFIVLFHSEHWPDIPPGTQIPIWEPVKRKV